MTVNKCAQEWQSTGRAGQWPLDSPAWRWVLLADVVSVPLVETETYLSKEWCVRSELCVMIIHNYFNVFSCEDEQSTGASISSWDHWIDSNLGRKEE